MGRLRPPHHPRTFRLCGHTVFGSLSKVVFGSSPERLQAFVRRPNGPSASPAFILTLVSIFIRVGIATASLHRPPPFGLAHYFPRQIRSSTSQRSSALRHRSSPTHAFGIFLALVSFLISIFIRAVRARPPSSRCRHHRHQRCHQRPIDHPQLPLRRRHSPGEFPRHLCTVCSYLAV